MKIEIWSDYVCPFCYMGERKLQEALSNFAQRDQVEIEMKSYQLDPNAPPYTGQDFFKNMSVKFGGVEQSKRMMGGIAEQAKEVGLEFNFDTMKPANTLDAHRLTKFATEKGKGPELAEKIMFANFTASEDIGDAELLASLAEEVGLDKAEALEVLKDSEAYKDAVKKDIEEAGQFGIRSVPHFIINRKFAISGGQPADVFLQALNQIQEEENIAGSLEDLSSDEDAACSDGSCAIPNQKN